MNDILNHEALSIAFRTAAAKTKVINSLFIHPEVTEDYIDQLITTRAKQKAEELGVEVSSKIYKGQEWYIRNLVEFSALTPKEKLDLEYNNAFAKVASYEEMEAVLQELA